MIDLLCAALTTGCEIALPLIVKKITEAVSDTPMSLTLELILVCGCVYIGLKIIDVAAYYYMATGGHIMGSKIETDMRRDLFKHLQKLSNSYYDNTKINELLNNKDIIRNQRKIIASINNSRIFKTIVEEYGSFHNYLKTFTGDAILYETNKTTNALSDAISNDLKKRGMTFVGSVTIYAYLQAIGVIYSHDKDCYLYKGAK